MTYCMTKVYGRYRMARCNTKLIISEYIQTFIVNIKDIIPKYSTIYIEFESLLQDEIRLVIAIARYTYILFC